MRKLNIYIKYNIFQEYKNKIQIYFNEIQDHPVSLLAARCQACINNGLKTPTHMLRGSWTYGSGM